MILVMCLQLYVATAGEQTTYESSDLYIQAVEATNPVHRVFSLPFVRLAGAHTGCSCGFPSVIAEQPIDYFDGMFWDSEDRLRGVASLTALLALIDGHVSRSSAVEVYAVWQGDEELPPKGSISVSLPTISPNQFFFIERFLYRIFGEP